jgi:hypothetical protein
LIPGSAHESFWSNSSSDDPANVAALVSEVLREPIEVVAAARLALFDSGMLDARGLLTAEGHKELSRCREVVTEITEELTAGIDPVAVETTLDTLDEVRSRAERLLSG